MDQPDIRQRGRTLLWAAFVFLSAFAIILALVSYGYLIPAFDAARASRATTTAPAANLPGDRAKDVAQLRAVSALLLAVVLVVLGGLLVATFRVGRFFQPRPVSRRTQTRYVDAWAEAGRRAEVPPVDEDGGEEDEEPDAPTR